MKVFRPNYSVVLREVPGEISIGLMVASCPRLCKDCSYQSLVKLGTDEISLEDYEKELRKNIGLATCVLFMGGEWVKNFHLYLETAKKLGYKTCLYTGAHSLSELQTQILDQLDFCKTGRWEGIPLTDVNTNQKFWDVKNQKDITYKFQK